MRDGDRLGVFTTTNLRDVLLMDRPPAAIRVDEIASFPAVSIPIGDDLFQAMILMLRHRVHRLVVRDDAGAVAGVLSQLDLMGFVANHSHLIAVEAAEDLHGDTPVGGAGLIVIDDVEQDGAALLRFRLGTLGHDGTVLELQGWGRDADGHGWAGRVRVHPASPRPGPM